MHVVVDDLNIYKLDFSFLVAPANGTRDRLKIFVRDRGAGLGLDIYADVTAKVEIAGHLELEKSFFVVHSREGYRELTGRESISLNSHGSVLSANARATLEAIESNLEPLGTLRRSRIRCDVYRNIPHRPVSIGPMKCSLRLGEILTSRCFLIRNGPVRNAQVTFAATAATNSYDRHAL